MNPPETRRANADEIERLKSAIERPVPECGVVVSCVGTIVPGQPAKPDPAPADGRPAEKWLLVLGGICALLGGFIGIIVGSYLWRALEPAPGGGRMPRYNRATRILGIWMLVVSVVSLICWNVALR